MIYLAVTGSDSELFALGKTAEEAEKVLLKGWKKHTKDTNYRDYRSDWIEHIKGIKTVEDLNEWQGVYTYRFDELPSCIVAEDQL